MLRGPKKSFANVPLCGALVVVTASVTLRPWDRAAACCLIPRSTPLCSWSQGCSGLCLSCCFFSSQLVFSHSCLNERRQVVLVLCLCFHFCSAPGSLWTCPFPLPSRARTWTSLTAHASHVSSYFLFCQGSVELLQIPPFLPFVQNMSSCRQHF